MTPPPVATASIPASAAFTTPSPASAVPASSVKKVVVAVHGIGDQVRNETVLSTAIRFCDHFGYEGLVSLGAFNEFPPEPGKLPPPEPALFINDPPPFQPCPGLTDVIGFVEVHWADIAREISENRYTLQETKAWAHSIVHRMRVFATHRDPTNATIDYRRIADVLEEIIDTIHVIESLLFVAGKAGLGEFKLREMLDAFIGDVQLVTEFSPIREKILQRFATAMAAIHARYSDAEIYIVSHSEGTVVSFLGLLEAAQAPARDPWLQQVRGYMTLGSPIDKHLILWPRLFDRYKEPAPVAESRKPPPPPIHWVNYVDFGDPVGFNLDTAREWLQARHYLHTSDRPGLFRFDPAEDFSFRRYPIPGKAHVDYWTDKAVFADFIQRVVAPKPLPESEREEFNKGPKSRSWVPYVSYGVGYLLPLLVIHLAAYVLCKAIYGYLDPTDTREHPNFVFTVLGVSWLVAGTTVWLRLVRLNRAYDWFWAGVGIYAIFAGGFIWLRSKMDLRAGDGIVNEISWFEVFTADRGWALGHGTLIASLVVTAVILVANSCSTQGLVRSLFQSDGETPDGQPMTTGLKFVIWPSLLSIPLLGAGVHWAISGRFHPLWLIPIGLVSVGFMAWMVWEGTRTKTSAKPRRPRRRSGRGQKPMIWIVGLVLLVFAIANEAMVDVHHGPLWRVIAAILIFLYLWWLSSLLFDLAFVWHRYIRGDAARRFLRETVKRESFAPENDPKTPVAL